jgi:hypothetical protein
MLDLSVFAIGLVAGWSVMFLRWPGQRAGLGARLLVALIWSAWALVSVLMVYLTDASVAWVLAGLGLGLAGHAMMVLRLQERGKQ